MCVTYPDLAKVESDGLSVAVTVKVNVSVLSRKSLSIRCRCHCEHSTGEANGEHSVWLQEYNCSLYCTIILHVTQYIYPSVILVICVHVY